MERNSFKVIAHAQHSENKKNVVFYSVFFFFFFFFLAFDFVSMFILNFGLNLRVKIKTKKLTIETEYVWFLVRMFRSQLILFSFRLKYQAKHLFI